MALPKEKFVTLARVREVLDYDPETGVFTWKKPRFRGRRAGSVTPDGLVICIDYVKSLHCHRVAWLWNTGRWPEHQIDHINGDPLDNRACNLREATAAENTRHRGMMGNNTSGVKGVDFYKSRWRARLMTEGKRIQLGLFKTREEAARAYATAVQRYHGEFARLE